MSIKAYVGINGSGKTYEVASVVIRGALARGRRVVSNIGGLDVDAFEAAIIEDGTPAEQIGELVCVSHEQVLMPEFWRTDQDAAQGVASFIQPGDLLALDEVWRFWDAFRDRKMPERVMNFVRMHRHFINKDTGVACDVALITQDVMDIGMKVRRVIEETYRTEKLTAIGSTRRYRVDVFHRWNLKGEPLRSIQKEYEPRYFGLYVSHTQQEEGSAQAVEHNIDGRGNILKGALFKVVLPVGALVFVFAVYLVASFFNPKKPPASAESAAAAGAAVGGVGVSHAKALEVSERWRAAGYVVSRDGVVVVVKDGERLRLLDNPPRYRIRGGEVESFLPNGEAVTAWSGGVTKAGLVPGAK